MPNHSTHKQPGSELSNDFRGHVWSMLIELAVAVPLINLHGKPRISWNGFNPFTGYYSLFYHGNLDQVFLTDTFFFAEGNVDAWL